MPNFFYSVQERDFKECFRPRLTVIKFRPQNVPDTENHLGLSKIGGGVYVQYVLCTVRREKKVLPAVFYICFSLC